MDIQNDHANILMDEFSGLDHTRQGRMASIETSASTKEDHGESIVTYRLKMEVDLGTFLTFTHTNLEGIMVSMHINDIQDVLLRFIRPHMRMKKKRSKKGLVESQAQWFISAEIAYDDYIQVSNQMFATPGSNDIEYISSVTENDRHAMGKRQFSTLNPVTQSALACKREIFREFLSIITDILINSESDAARAVRKICNVKSRAALSTSKRASGLWCALYSDFERWQGTGVAYMHYVESI